jgi:hypothetical protein
LKKILEKEKRDRLFFTALKIRKSKKVACPLFSISITINTLKRDRQRKEQ